MEPLSQNWIFGNHCMSGKKKDNSEGGNQKLINFDPFINREI